MIEQKATDQDGRIVFTADLPINGNYYVKEVQAPAGFVTTEEIKEFEFAYAGEEVAEVSFEFTYEDEPTTFEITKSATSGFFGSKGPCKYVPRIFPS